MRPILLTALDVYVMQRLVSFLLQNVRTLVCYFNNLLSLGIVTNGCKGCSRRRTGGFLMHSAYDKSHGMT